MMIYVMTKAAKMNIFPQYQFQIIGVQSLKHTYSKKLGLPEGIVC